MKNIFWPGLLMVGLAVTPSELKFVQTALESSWAKLSVRNASDEVTLFEVYPDDFESIVRASPSSFILEAGEKREGQIRSSFRQSGQYRTDISVLARPIAASSFNAAGGMKIPLTVSVSQASSWRLLALVFEASPYNFVGMGLLIFAAAALIFAIRYGVRKIKN